MREVERDAAGAWPRPTRQELHGLLATPRIVRQGFWDINGVAIRYWAVGSGPPVIVHPGGPGLSSWEFHSSPYAAASWGAIADCHQLILYDPRGCGESERLPINPSDPDPATYGVDRYVEDLEAIRVLLGQETISIIGNSFGGSVASIYATRHPHRIERLILHQGFLSTPEQRTERRDNLLARLTKEDREGFRAAMTELKAREREWPQEMLDVGLAFALLRLEVACHPPEHEAAARSICRSGRWKNERAVGHFGYWAHMMTKEFENDLDIAALLGELRAVEAPTLLTIGEHDFTPISAARATHAAIPNSELVVLPNAGHASTLDQPELVGRTLLAFLRGEALPVEPIERTYTRRQ